jgi:hypothetical protein
LYKVVEGLVPAIEPDDWVRNLIRRCVLDTPLCTPVSPTNKSDRHDITEILLNMALNTICICICKCKLL